ncbi:MAG: beta-ketoacyl-ACP synthase 3, partial [Deltaproteobacteria bacterium]|nr:beta-ketoacyl-ACP synthase 3 [Deltaproteobacteria bacterium]
SMASEASLSALQQGKLKATDIDAIIFATSNPDYHAPGSAVLLQKALGCKEIPAFDLRNTSSGFLYGLELADSLTKTGRYQNVLLVASEAHSPALDFSDEGRMMSVIFGDGAAAVIVQASEHNHLIDFELKSDGAHYDKLWCEGPSGLDNPRLQKQDLDSKKFFPQVDGRFVFKSAVQNMKAAAIQILKRNKMNVADLKYLVSHQANINIIKQIQADLHLEDAQVPTNIDRVGNTSGASIPILLDELNRSGALKSEDKLLFTCFGSGFCWGAALVQVV